MNFQLELLIIHLRIPKTHITVHFDTILHYYTVDGGLSSKCTKLVFGLYDDLSTLPFKSVCFILYLLDLNHTDLGTFTENTGSL